MIIMQTIPGDERNGVTPSKKMFSPQPLAITYEVVFKSDFTKISLKFSLLILKELWLERGLVFGLSFVVGSILGSFLVFFMIIF